MAILVTWQAFIPAGTVPPPATWPRSLRSRAARSRRYWQIVRIFTRCGVRPLGRGPRSVSLARSLTEALDRSGAVFVKFGQAMSTRRARRTEARVGWARAIGVVNLAEGFAAALREELDFRVEAGNLAAVGAANGAAADSVRVVIPRAYHDLSTRRVLVMERLDGQAL